MNVLKCPKCGSLNLYDDDCFDVETTFDYNRENEIVIRRINGRCEDCETELLWEDVYEFVESANVKVVNDNGKI